MTSTRHRRRRSSGYTAVIDAPIAGALLREAGFLGTIDDPLVCIATFGRAGEPHSLCARYVGGWACRLRWRSDGSYSLTQSLRVVFGGTA